MLIVETNNRFLPEKKYCFQVLLGELLGVDFEVKVTSATDYILRLPNGASLTVEDHFFSRQTDDVYLKSENIPEQPVFIPHPFSTAEVVTGVFGKTHFTSENQHITCGIDLFASAFFMLTRWEEYVLPRRDEHGRFPADQSLAARAGFLDRPVVDEWADLMEQMLVRLGWNHPPKRRAWQLHLSHDVDHPLLWWSAAQRLRTPAAGLFKRGDLPEAAWWLKNHVFRKQDPFDIFDEWMDLSEKNGLVSHFNFLGARAPSSNCYYPLDHPFVKNLIRKIADRGHGIGFHPSYEAFEDTAAFQRELQSLRAVSPVPVTTGRQHYLRFDAPHTWQVWEEAGLEWDSTLGYPEAEGFRCGTCHSFPVFNFLTRTTLRLREKPLIAMDVTLAQYRRYSPEKAFERLQHLRRQVQKHGGEFVLLWHNSSWNTYFWGPWQEVYRSFIAQ